jgi:hypothetical protein
LYVSQDLAVCRSGHFLCARASAQAVTVCVFLGKEPQDLADRFATDPENVAAELSGSTLPGGAIIQAIAVGGVKPT